MYLNFFLCGILLICNNNQNTGMKKILAFAGSTNPASINKQLISYTLSMVEDPVITFIDLCDFPLPVYSAEIEKDQGIPGNAVKLLELFDAHDAFIISVAEHNGSVTAAFKNMLDWLSRASENYLFFKNKPVLIFSASPSPFGGQRAAMHAEQIINAVGGNVIGKQSVPNFYQVISKENNDFEINDAAIIKGLDDNLKLLTNQVF